MMDQLRRLHCSFVPPVQDHSWIFVPLAVAEAVASRHSPDWTPVTVPLVLRFHCWFVCPLQSQITAAVPLLVPWPLASRHLVPYTINCLFAVYVQRWLVPPWQSHNCTCVPLAIVEPGTSTHRPDGAQTTIPFDCPGGGLPAENCHQFMLNKNPLPPANRRNRSWVPVAPLMGQETVVQACQPPV